MNLENLREEILGSGGFADWLRSEGLSGKKLAAEAQARVQSGLGQPHCNNVDLYLCRLLDIEYEIYLELERKLIEGCIEEFLNAGEHQQNKYPTLKALINNLQQELMADTLPHEKLVAISKPLALLYKLLTESFAQSRKTRAGSSAQYHVEFILNQLGFQGFYECQRTLNGTVDFLFPSYEMWKRDKRRCTILSIKRTLRERYKQVFEELSATGGLTLYLMTTQPFSDAQKDITLEKVQRLNEQNVYLVVRDAIKQERFPETESVIGFTQFFCRELPRLRLGWSEGA